MELEKAVDLLAEICQELIKRCDLKRGLQGERGPQGEPSSIPGPPGRDADVAEVIAAAVKAMQHQLQSAKDALRQIVREELALTGVIDSEGRAILIPGPQGAPGRDGVDGKDGRDGKDSTVPGPKGDVGSPGRDGKDSTVPGPTGVSGHDGRNGVDGKDSTVAGPKGAPGKNGATLEEVQALIEEIIGTSGDEVFKKFVTLKKEIGLIEADRRYQRVDSVRVEIAERLKQHLN